MRGGGDEDSVRLRAVRAECRWEEKGDGGVCGGFEDRVESMSADFYSMYID